MSAGTGTSSVASSGTKATGTSSASTSATESGSAPTFHSIRSAGAIPATSMLPGTSIAPAIAWIPATLASVAGWVANRSWIVVHGPSATIVTGDGRGVDDLGEEVLAERRELGPDDGRQDDAVHVVAARAPLLGERHSVGSGVVPAAGERDLGPAERDEDAAQVPQPGAAVDEAGAVDGDRAHVHRGVAEEHVDREQVVHAHVGRDDDRARISRLRRGGGHRRRRDGVVVAQAAATSATAARAVR